MKKIKAVIFDFDGTLADTIPLCVTCFRQTIEPVIKRSLSDEEIIEAFGPDEEGTIRKFAEDKDGKLKEEFLRLYASLHKEYATLFDGIVNMLQTLQSKGVKLALATGKGKEACAFSLETLGCQPFFTIVETGSPKGSRKKEAITNILHAFGDIDKAETIYVGDSAGDVKESKAVGIRAVSVAWAKDAKMDEMEEQKPEKIFSTVAAFSDWLIANV